MGEDRVNDPNVTTLSRSTRFLLIFSSFPMPVEDAIVRLCLRLGSVSTYTQEQEAPIAYPVET